MQFGTLCRLTCSVLCSSDTGRLEEQVRNQELYEEVIIDAHRYTAGVAIHVHIIVTRHGLSFKTPPASETCTREACRASGLVLADHPEVDPISQCSGHASNVDKAARSSKNQRTFLRRVRPESEPKRSRSRFTISAQDVLPLISFRIRSPGWLMT